MKRIIYILSIAAMSCCGTKKQSDVSNNTVTPVEETGNVYNYEKDATIPACVRDLIAKFQQEEKQNPPRSIYRYTYNGKQVYYVAAICCDFFSDLYDSDCKLIAHPDGGFTGKGDGTAPDFVKTRTEEKLIWNDDRK